MIFPESFATHDVPFQVLDAVGGSDPQFHADRFMTQDIRHLTSAATEVQMPDFVVPDADPMDELRRWLSEAADAGVSNQAAMVLATVGPDGTPSARALMARAREGDSITFFSHYESPKARDIDANPAAEAVFLWTALERQVRVRGAVSKTTAEESDAYWASRPRNTQLAILAAPQSSMVSDHASLTKAKAEVTASADSDVPRPEWYGGYRLTPDSFEFWQGRPEDRLHLRAIYSREADGGWSFGLMAP
ncbi:MAG TPA: pyridoxamine 5'-phosphate oxidase [Dehalococcoidia bacterium]|jgi:pyridoxamine 5'-phosphate oxidase|nr:pyridoxamine 5'-phosphate oxidase [Chloroflexota bacterium]HCV27254.1 pyridoxamine 5'-phosphate oxidase [Dehalococcoidia bacterium]|tara:strand:+ start:7567 stop:8310 length:744 start_codon:yes stop_codon:yes gene_type:complete